MNRNRTLAAASLAICAAALTACGSDSDSTPATPTPPAATTQPLSVTVIDGPIKGAVVCLDTNDNGLCDSGEPTGTTDASGKVTLTINLSDAGKHAVIANVGTDAVDADTGAVPVAYVMKAPADQATVVSPLTTLVQAQIESTGQTTADAASFVQTQTGLTTSPFVDYTAPATADATAAALARVAVATTQNLNASLAATVGSTDSSGNKVSQSDLATAIYDALLGNLPALAAAAADKQTAAATLASTLASQTGLTATSVATVIGVSKLPVDTSATTPTAGFSLLAVTFTDSQNWFYRVNAQTLADNTPDSNGLVHYYADYTQDVAGVQSSWGFGQSLARSGDLHWSGTAWVGCSSTFRSSQLPRDAKGMTTYNHCDSEEIGTSKRSAVDVSGQTIGSLLSTIHAFPGGSNGVPFANWATTDPTILASLGASTLPAGSKLYYVTNRVSAYAIGYDVTSPVSVYTAAVAAGGVASASPAPACGAVTVANSGTYRSLATTLDEVIARNTGTPCVFAQGTDGNGNPSLANNESWGLTTVGVGSLPNAVTPPTPYYQTTASIRLSFAATSASGGTATFYSCLLRASDGVVRNCTAIGSAAYAIRTLGDGRVLTLGTAPLSTQSLNYDRVFVERGGSVYFGYQNKLGGDINTVRVNGTAANALFQQLGIPAYTPQ